MPKCLLFFFFSLNLNCNFKVCHDQPMSVFRYAIKLNKFDFLQGMFTHVRKIYSSSTRFRSNFSVHYCMGFFKPCQCQSVAQILNSLRNGLSDTDILKCSAMSDTEK